MHSHEQDGRGLSENDAFCRSKQQSRQRKLWGKSGLSTRDVVLEKIKTNLILFTAFVLVTNGQK